MKSGGFGLGKKQARNDEVKSLPPTNADLGQLLATSRKSGDKVLSLVWVARGSQFTLAVANRGPDRDRRGWSSSAMDNSGVGDVEWKLTEENASGGSVVFSMRSSDSNLIHTLVEEAMLPKGALGAATAMPASVAAQPVSSYDAQLPAETGFANQAQSPIPAVQEGSLRQVGVRSLMESLNANKTTGRLICDIGTVQSEVFFTDGEPVHAKSCHSISQGRDTAGDASLIDLLTWKDGTYKFQEGWPAASKSISSPLHMFLSGSVPIPEAKTVATASPPAASMSSPALASSAAPPMASAPPMTPNPAPPLAAPAMPAPGSLGPADDFAYVDDLIGSTYGNLVEPSGLLKYGMFLMLVRSEFVRFERGKNPFCFASIGMDLANGAQLTQGALTKIGERFEKVCQPLDTLTYAGYSRFYALFPQTDGQAAAVVLKQFMNNVTAIPLDTGLHGSAVKFSVGVAEVPRDGAEFQRVFQFAGGLRGQATADKKMVSSSF